MKTPRSGTRPRVGNLFALAEAVGLFYGIKGTDAAIEESREVSQDYRSLTKAEGQVAWLTYLLRLLLTCPVLLKRPLGLEWATDDLQWALRSRRLHPEVDRDFWQAVTNVRGMLTRGRPGSKAGHFLRYELVYNFMHPVTTHPEFGLVRTQKRMSKTAAVTALPDMETRWCGQRPHLREIWRSLRWVDDYLAKLRTQLDVARSNVARRAEKVRR